MLDEFLFCYPRMVKRWRELAAESGSAGVYPVHVLRHLLEERKDVQRFLARMGITEAYGPSGFVGIEEEGANRARCRPANVSAGVVRAIEYAYAIALTLSEGAVLTLGEDVVGSIHLLMGLARDRSSALQPFFTERGLSDELLMARYREQILDRRKQKRTRDPHDRFIKQHESRQAAFKRAVCPELCGPPAGLVTENGTHSATPSDREMEDDLEFYSPTEWRLPEHLWELNIYAGIRAGLLEYMSERGIDFKWDRHHLLSSQMCCFNVMFVLREHPAAARTLLRPLLPGVREVVRIEFEDSGLPGLSHWLGGPLPKLKEWPRAIADVAITWLDNRSRPHVTYLLWKYTEGTFDLCSGFPPPTDIQAEYCNCHYGQIWVDPQKLCYLSTGAGPHLRRRYWEHLMGPQSPLREIRGSGFRVCPFRDSLHQLMLLELMAAYARHHAKEDVHAVHTAVISFSGNMSHLTRITGTMRPRASADLLRVWRSLLRNPRRFRQITIETLMGAYDADPEPDLNHWRDYLRTRYGV